MTPLHLVGMINAMEKAEVLAKATRIVGLLRQYGADPTARSRAGRTAKDNAHPALKPAL